MSRKDKLKGVFTALVTPFRGGKIDYVSLNKLLNQQVNAGVNGFVVNGTTGESPTLTDQEVKQVVKFVKQKFPEKTIIIGTGTNNTLVSIEKTKFAKTLGADAALVVVPYYNKPTQNGLFRHFSVIANKSKFPIILYNVPGRTITSLSVETICKLSKNSHIVGIKEATGDISFFKKLKRSCSKNFIFLSGDDVTYDQFLISGGDGVISVASHIIPEKMVEWTSLRLSNKQIKKEFPKYKKLIQSMFIEANPIPVKWMLFKMGILKSPELRLPLTTLSEKNQKIVNQKLKVLKLKGN